MTRFTRSANGKYVVHGKSYEQLIGTRAQVWHTTAFKTTGGLTKSDLLQNKNGRIVSRAKHSSAKKENRLVKAGFGTKKGKFGFVKLNNKTKSKRGGAGNMPSNNIGSNIGNNHGNNNNNNNNNHNNNFNNNLGNNNNPILKAAAIKSINGGRRRNKSRRGGSGMSALSPSDYDGKGVGTSGVDLQFIAGNAA